MGSSFGFCISSVEDAEYSGAVNEDPEGVFKATEPQTDGEPHSSSFEVNPKKCRALYHTHGGESQNHDDENFSPKDKANAKKFKLSSFLGTPSGKIKTYNP